MPDSLSLFERGTPTKERSCSRSSSSHCREKLCHWPPTCATWMVGHYGRDLLSRMLVIIIIIIIITIVITIIYTYAYRTTRFAGGCSQRIRISRRGGNGSRFVLAASVLCLQLVRSDQVTISHRQASSSYHSLTHSLTPYAHYRSTRPFLSLMEKKWFVYQLLCALAELHSRGVRPPFWGGFFHRV